MHRVEKRSQPACEVLAAIQAEVHITTSNSLSVSLLCLCCVHISYTLELSTLEDLCAALTWASIYCGAHDNTINKKQLYYCAFPCVCGATSFAQTHNMTSLSGNQQILVEAVA